MPLRDDRVHHRQIVTTKLDKSFAKLRVAALNEPQFLPIVSAPLGTG
jgi:hypothetical protein